MQVKLGNANLFVGEDREAGLLNTHQPLPQQDAFMSLMPSFSFIPAATWVCTWVITQLFAGHTPLSQKNQGPTDQDS